MADEKKPDAKPAAPPPPPERDAFVEIVSLVFVLFLVMTLLGNLVANISKSKLFSNGWSGLTPRGILLSHTRPIASLANPVGARIVSINKTDVFGAPAGLKIGTHGITDRGTILQGPVEINGERYWYVDYDTDPDGWVKESDIAYLESEPNFIERIIIGLLSAYWYFRIVVFILCIILIFAIIYLYREITNMRINEDKMLYPKNPAVLAAVNPKWQHILDCMESLNANDWKQAILEADTMLADILDRLALPGDTIGDKLKAVEQSDFLTIEHAWEAHKVRNQIAHEGSSFILSQREALRVMNLYKAVFEEFQII